MGSVDRRERVYRGGGARMKIILRLTPAQVFTICSLYSPHLFSPHRRESKTNRGVMSTHHISPSDLSIGSVQMTTTKKKKKTFCKIKSFAKNNKAIISDLTAKYVTEQKRVEALRDLLAEHGIEIPEEISAMLTAGAGDHESSPLLKPAFLPMEDGNIETLKKLLVSAMLCL
jgi:hypothetical protein